LAWQACPTKAHPSLQCASLKVPLDHREPDGEQITLALSRVPHTADTFQGPLLVNPGGPGAGGLTMAGFVANALPKNVAAQYDVIGFDPRGVGRSRPALNCRPGHFAPVRPDSLPRTPALERANLDRARAFARGCAAKHGHVLPFIDTVSTVQDMDAIRAAVGAERLNYFGYSYGTYLGAVYGKLYPHRVRRMALDSLVDPAGVWYEGNLRQDHAFDARHKALMAWIARHDTAYRLGKDPARIEAKWYAMRDALARRPAGKKVGAAELEDTFLPGGYFNGYWPRLAEAFAAYTNHKDAGPLLKAYEGLGATDAAGENSYSVYTAIQCRDALWPRSWETWREDNARTYAKAPFSTWNNAWYNAPCAFWPTYHLSQPDVSNSALPPVLLLQATDDPATPYEGLGGVRGQAGVVVEVDPGGFVPAVRRCPVEEGLRGGQSPCGGSGVVSAGVRAGLDESGERQHTRSRVSLGPIEGALRHVDGLGGEAPHQGLHGHGGQHVATQLHVAAGAGEPKGLDEVALGDLVLADVEGGPARHAGQLGGDGEEFTAGPVGERPFEERGRPPVETVGEGVGPPVPAPEPGVPAAGVVGGLTQFVEVGPADLPAAAAFRGVVGGGDEPAGDGSGEGGGGEGRSGSGQEVAAVHGAPERSGDADGIDGVPREIQPRVRVHGPCAAHADLTEADGTPEPLGDGLCQQFGDGPFRCHSPSAPVRDGRVRVIGLHPGGPGELIDAQSQGLVARATGFDDPGQLHVGRTGPSGDRCHDLLPCR
ncbi:alpha/beta hydrolase, partial [Streptomyces sp. NPDC005904]|uniref:alpha/beta hydrolase n=1 Tax=Streptomyces sp. NPDC005904 TaxID=3154570 RepID=UPI00340F25D7